MFNEEKTQGLSGEMRKACIGPHGDQTTEMESLVMHLREQTSKLEKLLNLITSSCDRLHPIEPIVQRECLEPPLGDGAINAIRYEAHRISKSNDHLDRLVNHMSNVIGN
jgi:hypothetical protein